MVGELPKSEEGRDYLTLKCGILIASTTSFGSTTYWSVFFPDCKTYFPPEKYGNHIKDGWTEVMYLEESLLCVCCKRHFEVKNVSFLEKLATS